MVRAVDQTTKHAEMHVVTRSKSTLGTEREVQNCKGNRNTGRKASNKCLNIYTESLVVHNHLYFSHKVLLLQDLNIIVV